MCTMADITYEIVEHDGGWAYKLGETLSETYRSRQEALMGAKSAASRQKLGDGGAVVRDRPPHVSRLFGNR
jgi:hypothetical protein